MRGKWKVAAACGISVVLVAAMAPAAAAAAAGGKGSTLEVLLDHGLSAPKGLSVTSDRNLVIAQGAILGPPPFPPAAPALIYDLRGKGVGTTTPVSDALNLTDVAVSPKDGTGWGIEARESGNVLVHQVVPGGAAEVVLDISAYQAGDPDPVDHDVPPFPTASNVGGSGISVWSVFTF